MIANNVLKNLSSNLIRLEKLQNQLSSGKKIIKPSDDPVSTSRLIELKSTLNANKQYSRNIDFLKTELNVADKALQDISSTLTRVKKLAVRGANETLSEENRNAIAEEVDQLIDHLIQIGNTNVSGRYIFGGYKTSEAPLEKSGNAVLYKGDGNLRSVEVSNNVLINASPTGKSLFVDSGMFDTLVLLRDALLGGNISQITETIDKIDAISDRVSSELSGLGARLSRVELTSDLLSEKYTKYADLLSKQEDIEIEEVVLKLYAQQNVYQASLISASRALQPSLINYLG
jgi:flagellar hook-associated protein 3 FlgL